MTRAAPAGPSALAAVGHVVVLCAFAVAQPVFDLLGSNPTFFVAPEAGGAELVVLALLLVVGPPLLVLLLVAALGVATGRPRGALLVAVAFLVATAVLPPLHRATGMPAWAALASAAASGVLAALGYARLAALRSFLTVLTPAALVFPLLFLFHSPVSRLLRPADDLVAAAVGRGDAPPIVFVVFDGLASNALLDGAGAVDAVRYPGFARLAATATWYRDTTTVSDLTQNAVPAILTGSYPRPSRTIPTVVDHPQNLFTVLAGGWEMDVHEILTELCPRRLCSPAASEPMTTKLRSMLVDAAVVYAHFVLPASLRAGLPPIEEQWRDFGRDSRFMPRGRAAMFADRAAAFDRFLEGIGPRPRPTLHFLHLMVPHAPLLYLPTGRQYAAPLAITGFENGGWGGDQAAAEAAEKRYLLQVGFVDRLVGRLLDRLEEAGMLDATLLVVTSDHGCSFLPSAPFRILNEANYWEIAPVPLFIKAPGQREGRISDEPIETIDVLPTVAALLGVELPREGDGRSALASPGRERRTFVLPSGKMWPVAADRARRDAAVANRIARLGADTPWEAMLARGPHASLVGASIDGMAGSEVAPYTVRLWDGFSAELHEGRPAPTWVEGELVPADGAQAGVPVVAVAVNGVVGATAGVSPRKGGALGFQAMVAETRLRPGANRFEVFVVDDRDPAHLRLARVPPHA